MKRKFVLQITMRVSDTWIEAGFDLQGDHLKNTEEYIRGLLPRAYGHEFSVKAKLIEGPERSVIRKLQGYEK